MDMNSTDQLCLTAQYLADNPYLRSLLICRIIIALTGIVLLIVLLRFQGRHLALHKNAQVLLISHHIWAILQCVSSITINGFDLHRYSQNHNNPCDYLITMEVSALLRGAGAAMIFGNIWALLFMAFERVMSTYNYQTYEKTRGYYWSGIFTVIEWFLSILNIYLVIMNADWSELKTTVTMTSPQTTTAVSNLTKSMAVVEIVALCIFYGLLRYNTWKKTQLNEASLTEKYQVDENMRSIRLMIPMVITHFCCFMPLLVGFPLYYLIDPNVDPRDYTVFLEASNTPMLYGVILPLVLFWRHKILRENLRKSLDIFNKITTETPRADGRTHDQVRHFELLDSVWKREIQRQ